MPDDRDTPPGTGSARPGNGKPASTTRPTAGDDQRDELLDAARSANKDEPRNFKEDALKDKVVRVEPDGTGPTSTGTFDPPEDQRRGSGNPDGKAG